MKEQLTRWLEAAGLPHSDPMYLLIVLALIALTSLLVHWLLHRIALPVLDRQVSPVDPDESVDAPPSAARRWKNALFAHHIFTRLSLTFQGVLVYTLARILLDTDTAALPVIEVLSHLWIILFALLAVFSILDALGDMTASMKLASRLPLRGIFQGVKLLGAIVALILAIALLIGKSPLILFSGLGAMTAILLLIFKDPILGLVAGIQLSANDMLRVGDWLEMPKYGADGDVLDINLTTVKVRNWDKTITSIPSYALISDSFKNWRNIEQVHGRRIKRAIHIDATSVRFTTDEDLARLRKSRLLTDYIEQKVVEIEAYNQEQGIDPSSPMNGRHLTNLGIFRAYLVASLAASEHINHDLTYMVRQLEPGTDGIPLEIYGFANQTSWVPYEGIQSDIFDHVFAVISEFGLRLHQSPTGHDIRQLGESLAGTSAVQP
ncbi:mechanosensitive ion channel family protein [Halofilum ochraceum]|uniref:mechanosensitive ion channel family protein n=1 Tax=Halofilum ochraceum TaxID=1611323 RepID=UPI0008DB31C0|nr:mechanosensitive ion channel family protein [Halofilum ochraceum]